jgi:hypothetical protein
LHLVPVNADIFRRISRFDKLHTTLQTFQIAGQSIAVLHDHNVASKFLRLRLKADTKKYPGREGKPEQSKTERRRKHAVSPGKVATFEDQRDVERSFKAGRRALRGALLSCFQYSFSKRLV